MNKWQLKNRIIKGLNKVKAELEQSILDMESWNDNHSDNELVDVGWEKSLLQCVTKQLAAWEVGDIDEVNRWSARMAEIAEANE